VAWDAPFVAETASIAPQSTWERRRFRLVHATKESLESRKSLESLESLANVFVSVSFPSSLVSLTGGNAAPLLPEEGWPKAGVVGEGACHAPGRV
jgi:hypothetical protein